MLATLRLPRFISCRDGSGAACAGGLSAIICRSVFRVGPSPLTLCSLATCQTECRSSRIGRSRTAHEQNGTERCHRDESGKKDNTRGSGAISIGEEDRVHYGRRRRRRRRRRTQARYRKIDPGSSEQNLKKERRGRATIKPRRVRKEEDRVFLGYSLPVEEGGRLRYRSRAGRYSMESAWHGATGPLRFINTVKGESESSLLLPVML